MIARWQVDGFVKRRVEKFWIAVAWHLPKPLVMWCAIRVGAHATQGQWGNESPTEVNLIDQLKRWETA